MARATTRTLVGDELLRRAPFYVVWELTRRCDQACRTCGSRAGRAAPEELSTAEVLALVAELAALECREITLIGGEAYLRSDHVDIVRAIVGHGMRVSLLTGGRALTRPRVQALRDAGLGQVAVSIDGLRATHEELRRVPGGFDLALSALANARDAGLPVSVNTQIHARSAPELRPLYEVPYDVGVRSWQVQLTAPMGRAADHAEWMLQPFQILDVVETLAEIQVHARERARPGAVVFDLWVADDIGYFGPHEALLRSRPGGHGAHWIGCHAACRTLGIEADGTVKPCLSMPTQAYCAGRVGPDLTLTEIWTEAEAMARCRAFAVQDLEGFCRSCYYAPECLAGCPSTTHAFMGARGDNPFCWHRADALRARGLRERLVPRSGAPGLPFDVAGFELVTEPLT